MSEDTADNYVSRGRSILQSYMEKSLIDNLTSLSEDNQFSSVISSTFPIDENKIKNMEKYINPDDFSPERSQKISQSHQELSTDEIPINSDSCEVPCKFEAGIKEYSQILAKLLVTPNDQNLKSELKNVADKYFGLVTEICTLTICLLDTWFNIPKTLSHSLPLNLPKASYRSESMNSEMDTINIEQLIQENKELKRKITTYKSQISKYCSPQSN